MRTRLLVLVGIVGWACGTVAAVGQDAPPPDPGTRTSVPAGAGIDIATRGAGTLVIERWDRAEVEVVAEHSELVTLEVKAGAAVEIREFRDVRAALEPVAYRIRVPATTNVLALTLGSSVTVDGLRGEIEIAAARGSVHVLNVVGTVTVGSAPGPISVEDITGAVQLHTTDGEISVRRVSGPITVENVSGTISVEGDLASRLSGTSSHGSLTFDGSLGAEAVLDLATQTGDVELRLPPSLSAIVTAGSARGSFSSDFPLGGVEPVVGEEFRFTVGTGAARLTVMTFSGVIRLIRRPGGDTR